MPNHVQNEVIFDQPQALHEAILAAVLDADGKVDFNKLVPMPVHIWRGNVGQKHRQAFGEHNIGLEWARLNWGTKWNAYQSAVTSEEESLAIRFQTAWSPPYPWIVALFNTFGGFRHNWLDEGLARGRAGIWVRSDDFGAEEWSEDEADDDLQRHLHKLLWGVEEFTDEDSNP